MNFIIIRLWKIVNDPSDENRARYTDIFIEAQRISLVETAKIMRAGIDSVSPEMPGMYCCCGNNAEFAYEIASVLAGKGNPVVVRINNGNYTPTGARYFSRVFQRAATQIEKLRGKVDIILAETDTCPQNRYSTGAMSLHTHYTGTILEGARGAKHWITRLTSYEPKSGEAYRRVLSAHFKFYERLASLAPTLKWHGCRIFTPPVPNFTYGRVKEEWDGWSLCVLERLGLPMYFSSQSTGVACLEGDCDSCLDDSQILEILSGSVILASDTAKRLIDRGFGKYIGVDVREWTGKQPIVEIMSDGAHCKIQRRLMELVLTSDFTVVDSYNYNTTDSETYERLFPAVTTFKNELGGTVTVFCGTPVAEFNIVEAFSFLNYSRKEQLVRILKHTSNLPIYYPGDEEIYFKCADMPDGRMLCAVFNIGLDPIEKTQLACDFEVKSFKALTPSAQEQEISFTREGNIYTLDIPCNILDPVIVFVER